MNRIYNFSAGPAMLPETVLKIAQEQMLCYENSGMSVMEMSHRSKVYEEIIFGAQKLLSELMNIPDNYKVLFLQGGASSQFAMVPMNLMNKNNKADYILTGQFAEKAYEEASRYGNVRIAASSKDKNYSYIPKIDSSMIDQAADYVHTTLNNTIFGTRYIEQIEVGAPPLVTDASSIILSEPIDVSKYGLIYAGAQKNMGPAGVTVVIVREDLLGNQMEFTPTMFNYKVQAKNDSMYNTPTTYSIYICKLVFEWIKSLGGIEAIHKLNIEKAQILYDYLDQSSLFKGTAQKEFRSLMNVTFVCPTEELNDRFVKEATNAGFSNLKGHRSVGGMRASIYNAMPKEGIVALVAFMKSFEENNA